MFLVSGLTDMPHEPSGIHTGFVNGDTDNAEVDEADLNTFNQEQKLYTGQQNGYKNVTIKCYCYH